MKRVYIFFLIMTIPLCTAAGDDFEVVYLEGKLETETSSGRRTAVIGAQIPEDSTVYLEEGALVELASSDTSLLFSKAGTYQLKSAARAKANMQDSAVKSVFKKISRITGEVSHSRSTAMGVRGSRSEDAGAVEWMVEEPSTASYEEALSAYQAGNYGEAITILEEEVDSAVLDDTTAYVYHLASAYLFTGNKGKALKITSAYCGTRNSKKFEDYLLLRGRLYLEALDFTAAAQQYKTYLELVSAPEDKQLGYYFYGLALLQQGKTEEGERAAAQAVDIDADREITRAARKLHQQYINDRP